MAIRRGITRLGELVLAGSGLVALARRRNRDRPAILAYHNVVPEGEASVPGEASLHLGRRRFARQLDSLTRHHTVVPLDELWSGDGPPGRVAITFDDAYAGAVTCGVEELIERGMPATFFVTPWFVGGRPFWWDQVAGATGGEIPVRTRSFLLHDLQGRHGEIQDWARSDGPGLAEPPPMARGASEDQLKAAAATDGIRVASHTWSHPNLTRLPEDERREELIRSREWLEGRFPRDVLPWLSYPYGLSDPAVRAAAAREHAFGLRIEGGLGPASLHEDGDDRMSLPRINVPAGLSPEGLLLRLAGLHPG